MIALALSVATRNVLMLIVGDGTFSMLDIQFDKAGVEQMEVDALGEPRKTKKATEHIMRRILLTTAAAVPAIALALGAAAGQTTGTDVSANAPRAGGMSLGEVVIKIEAQGYRVLEVDTDDGFYEVEAIDPSGMRVEAGFNPATGEPLRGWRQDR